MVNDTWPLEKPCVATVLEPDHVVLFQLLLFYLFDLLLFLQEPGMLEHLAPHLPEEHRHMEGLLAVATSSQVPLAHLTCLGF